MIPIILCRLAQLQFIYLLIYSFALHLRIVLFEFCEFSTVQLILRPVIVCVWYMFFFGFLFRFGFWKYGWANCLVFERLCRQQFMCAKNANSFVLFSNLLIFMNSNQYFNEVSMLIKKGKIRFFSFRWFSHTLDQNMYAWNIIKWAILLLNHIELNIFHGMRNTIRRLERDEEWSI